MARRKKYKPIQLNSGFNLINRNSHQNNQTSDKEYDLLCKALHYKKFDEATKLLTNNCIVNCTVGRPAETPLHLAIKNGGHEIISMLLAHEADVNAKNYLNETPLHYAVAQGFVPTVKLIIDKGANLNALSKNKKTPLHVAMEISKKRRIPMVKMLLKRGVNVDICDPKGRTALLIAVEKNDLSTVKLIIDKGANLNALTKNKKTPLHIAMEINETRRFPMVKMLLKRGANVDICDPKGRTALLIAVEQNDLSTVKLIIDKGANLNALTKNKKTPLHIAMEINETRRIPMVKMLLKRGANVDICDPKGRTALLIAVEKNDLSTVKLIIDKGANLNALSKNKKTPLHIAMEISKKRRIPMVKMLLKRGANVDICDPKGRTALLIAVEKNDLSTVKLIIDKGANLNALTKNKKTPLHIAMEINETRRIPMVKMLLKRGANVDICDPKGRTALLIAVEKNDLSTVKLIIDKGANLNALTKNKKTPLHIAMEINETRRIPMVKMLLKRGANVDICDPKGRTALLIAVEQNDLSTVKTILFHRPDVKSDANRKSLLAALRGPISSKLPGIVDLLLHYGFNVVSKDAEDANLVHSAVKHGCFKIVETFLNFGADVNTLQVSKQGGTLLHTAASCNHFGITELLLSRGANVNAKDNNQNMAIAITLLNEDEKITILLLKEMLLNSQEGIPELFHAAVKKLFVETVKLCLQQANIDVNARDKSGRTALHALAAGNSWNTKCFNDLEDPASKIGDFEVILKLLTDRGIDVNARDKIGRTALHIAMMKKDGFGCAKVVKLLVNLGADIDIKDEKQVTPLHLASYVGNVNAVGGLLEFDASTDKKDKLGRTPLHVAAKYGREQAVWCLVSSGADLNITCNASYTPLDYAILGSTDVNVKQHDDLYMDDLGISPVVKNCFRGIIFILMPLIIAEKAFGFPISDKNRRYIDIYPQYNFLTSVYQSKMVAMKTVMIAKSKISLYDVVTMSLNRLAFYANNDSFVKGITSASIESKLEYSRIIISRRLRQVNERRAKNLLGLSAESLHALTRYRLSIYCALEISRYLENEDLKNLIKAYPCEAQNRLSER